MKRPHHRRQFLHLAAGAAALPAVSRFALAQVQTDAIAIEEATIANLQAAYGWPHHRACCHPGSS